MLSMNLIPQTLQRARARRRRFKRWALSIVTAAAVLTVPLVVDRFRAAEAARLRAQNVQLQTQVATSQAQLRTLTAQANQTLVQLQRAEALRSKRAWSALLGLVARRIPPGCWLTSIATDPAVPGEGPGFRSVRRAAGKSLRHANRKGDEEPDSPVTIDAPRKIRMTGYAADAAEPHQFVTNLKKAAVFAEVTLETASREPMLDGSYYRFELVCEW